MAQNHLKEDGIAILVQVSDTNWNTDFSNDPKRMEYHQQKMNSKDSRPAQQLQLLRFDVVGRVYHMNLQEFENYSL